MAAEAARMPAGMRVLEEEERHELLDALSRSKHDTEAQLRALPFVIETPTQVAQPSLNLPGYFNQHV